MVQATDGSGNEERSESIGPLAEVKIVVEAAKKPRTPKRIKVRVVGKYGKGVIIERVVSGEPVRAIASVKALEYRGDDVLISRDDLDACIPYGVDWEKHLKITFVAEDVARMLRKRGIWTLEDFKARFVQARQGAFSMIAQDLMQMFKAAKKEAR